jgi:ABC-type nickel/cobalt efflux system permease component RcnA
VYLSAMALTLAALLLVALVVALNVWNRTRRARMTPAERAAHDAEIRANMRDFQM